MAHRPQYLAVLALGIAALSLPGCGPDPQPPAPPKAEPRALAEARARQQERNADMNPHLSLYSLVKNGASFYVGNLDSVELQSIPPAKQLVAIRMRIEETLFGTPGPPARRCEVMRPADPLVQAKFSDPIWGQVDLRQNARILMATRKLTDETGDPDYVDEIKDSKDPVLLSVREVLKEERIPADESQKVARWTAWVQKGPTVHRLYGAEALARTILSPEQADTAAAPMAAAIDADRDEYVQVSLATWLWEKILPRCGKTGYAVGVNSMLAAATSPSPNLQRLALDKIAGLDPGTLNDPAIAAPPAAVGAVRQRAKLETDGLVRARVEQIAKALER